MAGRLRSAGWAGLLGGFGLLFSLTIRSDHYGGDFALYILHAANIAQGLPYAQTGFIADAQNSLISPAAYPPGWPILLAPAYAIWGLDFGAFKLINAATLLALLPAVYALFLPAAGSGMALLIMMASALMPALFDRRDVILSDVPFTLWCTVALLLCDRIRRHAHASSGWLLALAAAVAMACMTRSAGLALLGALGLVIVLRRQGRWQASLAAVLAGAAAALLIDRMLHVDSGTYIGYLDSIRSRGVFATLADAMRAYSTGFGGIFGLSFGAVGNAIAAIGLALLVGWGWMRQALRDFSAPEAFLLAYAGLLLVYPVSLEPVRYLVPVAPLLLGYAALAVQHLCARRTAYAVVALGCAGLFGPNDVLHNPLSWNRVTALDAPSQDLFAALQNRTSAGDVVLAANPRVIVLMTGRRAAIWPFTPTPVSLQTFASRIGARWAVADGLDGDASNRAAAAILPAMPHATCVWRNARYTLWRFAG